MKYALAAIYIAAGITTSSYLSEMRHLTCRPVEIMPQLAVVAIWPLAGIIATYSVAVGNHVYDWCPS